MCQGFLFPMSLVAVGQLEDIRNVSKRSQGSGAGGGGIMLPLTSAPCRGRTNDNQKEIPIWLRQVIKMEWSLTNRNVLPPSAEQMLGLFGRNERCNHVLRVRKHGLSLLYWVFQSVFIYSAFGMWSQISQRHGCREAQPIGEEFQKHTTW